MLALFLEFTNLNSIKVHSFQNNKEKIRTLHPAQVQLLDACFCFSFLRMDLGIGWTPWPQGYFDGAVPCKEAGTIKGKGNVASWNVGKTSEAL